MPASREGKFSNEQLANASIIINVGKQMGASARDIQIALMTAMQESRLKNLNYGDRDSVGLFQQRTSQGWGSIDQIMDPNYSSRKFYSSLLKLSGRDRLSLTQAAQKVQRSAYPDAYAKWEKDAFNLLGGYKGAPAPMAQPGLTTTVGGNDALLQALEPQQQQMGQTMAQGNALQDVQASVAPGIESDFAPGSLAADKPVILNQAPGQAPYNFPEPSAVPQEDFNQALGKVTGSRSTVLSQAERFLGTPYVWGGTSPNGFDCSGLVQYVYGKVGVHLPRLASQQAAAGQRVAINKLRPGDLVAFDWDGGGKVDHISIYLGGGQIIEAPRPGLSVRIRKLRKNEGAIGVRLDY